jgi:predicted DNA-binding transcriptional regulator YafY
MASGRHVFHSRGLAMARGEQIQRHWNLLKTLQTRGEGIPLRDLADEFDVSERTIQRDFEILQELGFPIEHEDDEYGKRFWRIPHDFFRTGPLVMGLTEAVSLHLAERLFRPLAGTHFAEGLESVLEKIRSLVPQQALDYFAELDETIHVRRLGTTDYSIYAGTIQVLAEAAREDKSVDLTYRSLWRGEEYTTRFDPYGLVLYEGDLFAVGRSHRADALRIFKVTRIQSATATAESFERPGGFSLETHFRDSFGITQTAGTPTEIVAKFTGPAAGLVEERIWHESQQLHWLPADDTLFDEAPDEPEALIATFRLGNVVEFKQWIKTFGNRAEVLKPDWLRQELHDELRAAARLYEPPGTPT